MSVKIQFRRDTSANWSNTNPIPSQGEPCFETDTNKWKIGDGSTAYNSLPYFVGGNVFDSISVSGNGYFSGDVGIGTITPDLRLHLKGDGSTTFAETVFENTLPATDVKWGVGSSDPNGNMTFTERGVATYLRLYRTTGILESLTHTPMTDDTYDLGSSSLRWNDIFATNTTIQTSDERKKDNITELNDPFEILDLLRPVSFKWKDYDQEVKKIVYETVEGKNISREITENIEKKFNRTHFGMIAQDLEESLISRNIDPNNFAPFVYDEKEDIYGIRYSEFIPFLIKAVQIQKEEINILKSEIEIIKNTKFN